MIPVSLYTGWVKSVVYVSALSLWALVSGHWSASQAARVEVTQQEEERARDKEDLAAEELQPIGGCGRPRRAAGAGGGRYLLDTVKGSDLGATEKGLVLDFNYAYNPSCSYDASCAAPSPRGVRNGTAGPVSRCLRGRVGVWVERRVRG